MTKPTIPTLPQDDHSHDRESELETRKNNYRFVHDWPAGVATNSWLPDESNYSAEYSAQLVPVYARIAANFAKLITTKGETGLFERIKDAFDTVRDRFDPETMHKHIFSDYHDHAERAAEHYQPEHWKEYADIFATWPEPDIVAKIDDDETLGDAVAWQRIAGVNPTVLARASSLPEDFPVTQEHFAQALPDDSLEAALAEGRAFLADYRAVEGIECGQTPEGIQKYLAGPIALYVADKSGTLRSVAVQCGSDPSRFPVRTPADGYHWRMANQCVQVTDANHHEGSAHLGRTHLVMEAVGISMKRELASNHPLAVLLEPHLRFTFAINHSAKTDLIAAGGTVDQVFAPKIRAFGDFVQSQVSTYSIRNADPRVDLANRGLDDTSVLPVHPYRDDMLPVHAAIGKHVDRYVRLYYASNADVAADTELAAFVRALGADDQGRLCDVPDVNTVEDVVKLITSFVWIGSAQHSSVNFPQFRFMGYQPNMAGALFAPVPDKDTPNTEAAYGRLLPPIRETNSGASMVYLLSELQESTLGKYDLRAFVDPRVAPVIGQFSKRLEQLERDAQERDESRWLPYPYLHPSNILQSISI